MMQVMLQKTPPSACSTAFSKSASETTICRTVINPVIETTHSRYSVRSVIASGARGRHPQGHDRNAHKIFVR